MITQQIQQRYLNLPVKNGAPKRQVNVLVDGQLLHDFHIELAEDVPDFWVILDMDAYRGKKAVLQIHPPLDESIHVEPVIQSDGIIGSENLYCEALRPQFHFTARRGWLNDPNGLVWFDGTYQLFYQHNPYGCAWGNMHWGHATSPDLVHWQEHPIALYPDGLGTMYSGCAVIDWENTSGFQQGTQPPMVMLYTAAGGDSAWSKDQPFTQCLAYSTDGGKTLQKYAGSPVLPWIEGANRDPKVIWHSPTHRWVMVLYLEDERYAIFTSPDLKQWHRTDSFAIPGCSECPDIFALPVDGDPNNMRWVLWGANTSYLLGQFDGENFTQQAAVLNSQHFGSAYAAQTYSDIPAADGRRIQFGWLRGDIPGMPFNQQMAFPVSLSLRTTANGIRLCYQPVTELERLHAARHSTAPRPLNPGENPLAGLAEQAVSGAQGAYDIRLEVDPAAAAAVGLVIRGAAVVYDAGAQTLTCQGKNAPLAPVNGKIQLQVLVDRASLEIFANQGEVYLPLVVVYPEDNRSLEVFARGGTAAIRTLEVYELKSAWDIP
jgi:fructan beta-fructosidase